MEQEKAKTTRSMGIVYKSKGLTKCLKNIGHY